MPPCAAVRRPPPGLFAKNYGSASPVGIVMAHVIYGLVLGLVYSILT